jgi:YD repeat-containing protein
MDRTANYLNLIAIISLSGVITTACSDSFMKSSIRNKTSGLAALSTTIDEAGNITATIDPNATTTQIMRFDSGALAGSAIAIPPGSLSIPVEITVGQGPTLSSADFLAEIGLTNAFAIY